MSEYNYGPLEHELAGGQCGDDCHFGDHDEPPAPRAGERAREEEWSRQQEPIHGWVIYGDRRVIARGIYREEDAAQIVTEHNQYATLIGQRERLLATLQKLAAFDDAGGNMVLRKQSDYSGFDEPGAVRLARELIATIEREGV